MSKPVAVIIGAGPGIGGATALRFAREGYDLGLVARNADRLAELARTVEAAGANVGYSAVDAGDPAALTRAVTSFGDHTGRIDVLHHNAVAFRQARPHELSAEDLLADLAVGVGSLVTAVRAALPRFIDQHTGTILVTGSGAADSVSAGAATLGAQKAALRNLVAAYAADLGPQGIHVATLTIRGVLAPDTPFAPDVVADALFGLVAETATDPRHWRTVVDLTEDGAHPPARSGGTA